MKAKSIFKYTIFQDLRGYGIFVCVLLAIMHLFLAICLFTNSSGGLGGMEASTIIFTTLIGIMTYKENFKMSVQNGVSRKSFYVGNMLSCFIIAVIAALGDTLYSALGRFYAEHINKFEYYCLYEQLYSKADVTFSLLARMFLFYIAVYMLMIFFGLFVGALLNRLSKIMKIAVPVSIYILFVIIGFIDTAFLDSVIMHKMFDVIMWFAGNSMHLVYVCPILAILFAAGGYLFARRMAVNDKM